MHLFRLIPALAAMVCASAAAAPGDNRFAIERNSNGCAFAVVPHREVMDIALTAPDIITVHTTYELVPGSGMKLKFGTGKEVSLGALENSDRRHASSRLPPEAINELTSGKRVTVTVKSDRGPLFRRVGLSDFADGYTELASCAK